MGFFCCPVAWLRLLILKLFIPMYENFSWLAPIFSNRLIKLTGRFPLSFQVFPALTLAIGILFLPESPRWLMEQDRSEEARATIHKLHYDGSNEEFLELEFIEIRDAIRADRVYGTHSWTEIFSRPSWRRRLMLGCGIQAFGQLSGINGTSFHYEHVYFSKACLINNDSHKLLRSPYLRITRHNHSNLSYDHRDQRDDWHT